MGFVEPPAFDLHGFYARANKLLLIVLRWLEDLLEGLHVLPEIYKIGVKHHHDSSEARRFLGEIGRVKQLLERLRREYLIQAR